jgi:hypothetical protein
MCYEHTGQGHAFCRNCSHIVRHGQEQCSGCGARAEALMPFDRALSRGHVSGWGDAGFDPGDGPYAPAAATAGTADGLNLPRLT